MRRKYMRIGGGLLSIGLVFTVLVGRPAVGEPGQLPPDRVRGQELYEVNCWMCHGAQGLGDGPAAQSLSTPVPALAGRIPAGEMEAAADIVMQGRGDMPGYMETLNRRDATRILEWLAGLDPETGEDRD